MEAGIIRHGRDTANFKKLVYKNNTRLLKRPSLVNFDFIMNTINISFIRL